VHCGQQKLHKPLLQEEEEMSQDSRWKIHLNEVSAKSPAKELTNYQKRIRKNLINLPVVDTRAEHLNWIFNMGQSLPPQFPALCTKKFALFKRSFASMLQ